jgi:hypothetical protein
MTVSAVESTGFLDPQPLSNAGMGDPAAIVANAAAVPLPRKRLRLQSLFIGAMV